MSDYPTVDRVIAELKRLSAHPWHTDREREIGNAMVDARHCLEHLLAEVSALNQEASDKFWDVVEEGGDTKGTNDKAEPVAWWIVPPFPAMQKWKVVFDKGEAERYRDTHFVVRPLYEHPQARQ